MAFTYRRITVLLLFLAVSTSTSFANKNCCSWNGGISCDEEEDGWCNESKDNCEDDCSGEWIPKSPPGCCSWDGGISCDEEDDWCHESVDNCQDGCRGEWVLLLLPTNDPTISPRHDLPSTDPTSIPTSIPSSVPTVYPLRFDGVESAFSVQRGLIEMNWDLPTFHDEIPDLELTLYHIFMSVGKFDYGSKLKDTTVDEMIALFQESNTTQYHIVPGEDFEFALETESLNQVHSILVIAQVDDIRSENTEPVEIVASDIDPHVRDGVTVKGVFVPTDNLDIVIEGDIITFSGLLLPEHQSLVSGDIITGITSDADSFMLQVVEVLHSTASLVVLQTLLQGVEKIFDELEFQYSFPTSRKDKVALSHSSRRRYGRLLTRMNTRRLFIGSIISGIKDAVNFIGDLVVGVVKEIIDAISNLVQGKLEKKLEIIDMSETFEAFSDVEALSLTAGVNIRSDLIVKLRISFTSGAKASTSFKVSYYMDTELAFSGSIGNKIEREFSIWEGQRKSKVFFIGPVPVEVNWQPKIDGYAGIGFSLEADAKFSAGFDGEASMSASVALPGGIKTDYQQPTFNPFYKFEFPEASVSVDASVAAILSVDVGVYGGVIETNTGLYLGISLGSELKSVYLESESKIIPALSKFDLNLDFKIPFSVGTELDNDLTFVDTNFYEDSWPILQLPQAKFYYDKHFCEIGKRINTATIQDIVVSSKSNGWIKNGFRGRPEWFIGDKWDSTNEGNFGISLQRRISSKAHQAEGEIYVAIKPQIPPLPLPVVYSVNITELLGDQHEVMCLRSGTCSESFFDTLSSDFSSVFDTSVFLSQSLSLNSKSIPSTIYKFGDFIHASNKLKDTKFEYWLGDNCNVYDRNVALVNIATFLGQAMGNIIHDVCDEINLDMWLADIFKDPTSPLEIPAAFYPMSSSCGQMGQNYADYKCEDACPRNDAMEITATTNEQMNIGWAPPPLFCGPKSKYDDLGYWNPIMSCQGKDGECDDDPFYYPGQTAGVHVNATTDPLYPEHYYQNPMPDSNGNLQSPRPLEDMPLTNVEGCCWWGRGVIQTTGRCSYGKLNKNFGAGAEDALYPDINFCENPQALCEGPAELKWIAGLFQWTSEVESNFYKKEVTEFIDSGCMNCLEQEGCDKLFKYASGIVHQGNHDPIFDITERVETSKLALRVLMGSLDDDGCPPSMIPSMSDPPSKEPTRGMNGKGKSKIKSKRSKKVERN